METSFYQDALKCKTYYLSCKTYLWLKKNKQKPYNDTAVPSTKAEVWERGKLSFHHQEEGVTLQTAGKNILPKNAQ